jgi:hypothetical protein
MGGANGFGRRHKLRTKTAKGGLRPNAAAALLPADVGGRPTKPPDENPCCLRTPGRLGRPSRAQNRSACYLHGGQDGPAKHKSEPMSQTIRWQNGAGPSEPLPVPPGRVLTGRGSAWTATGSSLCTSPGGNRTSREGSLAPRHTALPGPPPRNGEILGTPSCLAGQHGVLLD